MALLIPAFTDDLTYPFSSLRMMMNSLVTPGVVRSGDMLVTPAAGLQVQIAAGSAYVQQTVAPEDSFLKGLYLETNDAPANPANTILAPITNPRIDQVILRVYDVKEQVLGGSSKAQFEWLQGVETAGAQINNPAGAGYLGGAAALLDNSLRLAYVLQTVGEVSIPGGNILDVRTSAAPKMNYAIFTGNATWFVPAGVTKIRLRVSGGGAGGGGGASTSSIAGSGGGGGGAGYLIDQVVSLNALDISLALSIGSAGPGGAAAGAGTAGGASTVIGNNTSTTYVSAHGGAPGAPGSTTIPGSGGSSTINGGSGGGAPSSSNPGVPGLVPSLLLVVGGGAGGGSGAFGNSSGLGSGGSGGGACTSSQPLALPSGGTGGSASAARSSGTAGATATVPGCGGGGGGGAGGDGSLGATGGAGGAGAPGQIEIWW